MSEQESSMTPETRVFLYILSFGSIGLFVLSIFLGCCSPILSFIPALVGGIVGFLCYFFGHGATKIIGLVGGILNAVLIFLILVLVALLVLGVVSMAAIEAAGANLQ